MTTDKLALLAAQLQQTLNDSRLSTEEKSALQLLVEDCSEEERRFLVNRAFDSARPLLARDEESKQVFMWLERVTKALQPIELNLSEPQACFSPGDACRNLILQQLNNARESIDICVFTISDNSIAEAILAAHKRGPLVRIITDNEKAHDHGSDIEYLAGKGIAIREDASADHMHHKFAIFDKKVLLNGSFNWTRSASERNRENLAVNFHPNLLQAYQNIFEKLWDEFANNQL